MSRRLIIPSAEIEFESIANVYGIGQEVNDWCRQIATEAHRDERPLTGSSEVPFEEVFAKLEFDSAMRGSSWANELGRFLEMHGDDVSILKRRLSAQQPSCRLRRNCCEFRGLSDRSVPVEVQVVYDVQHDAGGTVTFLWFGIYTPEPPAAGKGTSDTPKTWR